jgi:ABC-type microcin C transport system permease subunit YejB
MMQRYKMKRIKFIGGLVIIIMTMSFITCCCGGGIEKLIPDMNKKSVMPKATPNKTMKTPTPKPKINQDVKNKMHSLNNEPILNLYSRYENDILKDEIVKTTNLTQNGLTYKITFKDGSKISVYCEYLEGAYVIKSIQ